MAATLNWRHAVSGKIVDGGTLPSGTALRVSSRRHLMPPTEYEVFQLLPKPFWRFWGSDQVRVTSMEATPLDWGEIGGWYVSPEVWRLPEADNADGTAKFRAVTDTGDGPSGPVSSSRIWLDEVKQRRAVTAEAQAQVDLPVLTIGPKTSGERGLERTWNVKVADDPWVEISLLQGSEVLEHLVAVEEQYSRLFADPPALAMRDLPPDTATYFVDRPFGDSRFKWRLEPSTSLIVSINAPIRQDLRAAMCLCATDLADGATFVSSPVFLTSLREKVVVTDLTIDMLRGEARDVLQAFDDANLSTERFAAMFGISPEAGWNRLVQAADELGADSISDAARFAGLAAPAFA